MPGSCSKEELLEDLERLFDALDDCDVQASAIKAHSLDRDNRRALAEVERLIERAMDIVEDLK